MGLGDEKRNINPSYAPIVDDVIGKRFAPVCMRSCPHPKVIEKYGVGGVANVSVWVCRKCRYHKNMEMFGGVKCEYKG